MSVIKAFIVPHPPLIIPEVGKGQEKGIQKTIDAYNNISRQIADIKPETIILISPHSISYSDYIHISPGYKAKGTLSQFGVHEEYKVLYDTVLVNKINDLCEELDFPAGTLGEKSKDLDHGTIVPLHFVNQYYTDYKLVRCSISGLSLQEHYYFGTIINNAINNTNRKTIIIASGDLSHKLKEDGPYGFAPAGPQLDKSLTTIMKTANFVDFFRLDPNLSQEGADCGLASFVTMAGILDKKEVEPNFLSYEGPFGVGYAICTFNITSDNKARDFLVQYRKEINKKIQIIRENEDEYVKLARLTLEYYIKTGRLIKYPDDLPDEITKVRAGVFVSIKKDGKLRGCIGTTESTSDNIGMEIMYNAISAGTKDPRFSPIEEDELQELVYSVDILSNAKPVDDISKLNPKRFGIIVTSGRKRGLLLPNLDGVNTVEQQIQISCDKAGIHKNEKYILEYFEVVRHQYK